MLKKNSNVCVNMQKIALLIVLFILGLSLVNAQDLIVMHDGTTIEAIIMEVSPTEIRFRRADNPEGPVRVISTLDVNLIMYENRSLEFFEANRSNSNQLVGTKKFSVFTGMSLANHGGDVSGLDTRAGYVNLGASAWLPDLVPNTIVEPGIRLVSKGSKFEMEMPWPMDDYDIKNTDSLLYLEFFGKAKLDMLDMPVLPFAGISAGFLLSANRKIEMDGESNSADIKDAYNAVDFGLLFGLDYIIANRVSIGFEYNLGLANILDTSGDKMTNNTMLFMIGVLF